MAPIDGSATKPLSPQLLFDRIEIDRAALMVYLAKTPSCRAVLCSRPNWLVEVPLVPHTCCPAFGLPARAESHPQALWIVAKRLRPIGLNVDEMKNNCQRLLQLFLLPFLRYELADRTSANKSEERPSGQLLSHFLSLNRSS